MTVQELWSKPELWGKWAVVRVDESRPFTTRLRVDRMMQTAPVTDYYLIITDNGNKKSYDMVHADEPVDEVDAKFWGGQHAS